MVFYFLFNPPCKIEVLDRFQLFEDCDTTSLENRWACIMGNQKVSPFKKSAGRGICSCVKDWTVVAF
jgi:hypothetical protein